MDTPTAMDRHARLHRSVSLRAYALPSLWAAFLLYGLLLNVVKADDCSVKPLLLSVTVGSASSQIANAIAKAAVADYPLECHLS